jgi:ABC transport system ATP-binding/permease protein
VLKEDKRVIDVVRDIAENIEQDKSVMSASRFLFNFGFSYNTQNSYVSSLSGGEKRRLQLLMVMVQNPNFLILDEPTNDLDIQTLNSLEDFLDSYKGCLLMVSHDRYFLDNLTDHLFVFEGNGKVRDFPGNYTEYSLARARALSMRKKTEKPKKEEVKTIDKEKPRKPTFKETREFETIEDEIAQFENEKNTLLKQMNSGQGSAEEYNRWALRYSEVEKLLDEKTNRWIELSELF